MGLRKIFGLACAIALLSAVPITAIGANQQPDQKAKAPDVKLTTVSGETVPFASLAGNKPVLVVFWASWCSNCRDEIPQLGRLDAGRFKVVAVNEGESAWKTKRYVSTNTIRYQVVLDPDGAVAKAFQVPGVPACVIVNKAGLVVYRGIGLPENIDSYVAK